MIKKFYVFLLILLFSNPKAFGNEDAFLKAMKFFQQKEYVNAYHIFSKLMNDNEIEENKKVVSKFYAADCLLNIQQYDAAAILLESFVNDNIFSTYRENALYKLGELYYKIGSYRKSRNKLFALTESYPNTSYKGSAYYWIAESYYAEKKYLEAEEYFQKAIELRDYNEFIVNTLYSFAQLYEEIGNYSKSVQYYDELLSYYKDSPLAPLAQFRIGISYFNSGQYDNAIIELTDPLISKLPKKEQLDAKYYLAISLLRINDYQSALLNLSEMLKENLADDVSRKVNYSIAWTHFQLNNYEKAYEIFSKLSTAEGDTISVTSLYWSGECKRYMNDYKSAEEIFKIFLDKYPTHRLASRAQLSKGTIFYTTNNSKEAETSLVNATIYGDALTKSKAFTLLGEMKLNNNEFGQAKNYFISALKLEHNDEQLLNRAKLGYAISEFYLNNFNSALRYLEELNSKYNSFESDKVNFYLAEAYFSKKEYAAALKHYNKINSSDENLKKQTLLGKAYTYFNLKDFANAVYYFNEYVNKYRKDKNINEVKLRLADSYYALKNFEKASLIYKEIFSSDKNVLENDQTYYQYCQSLYKAGKSSEAIQEFANLQKKFPKSKYADASQYVIGWIYFQRGNFKEAINNYFDLIKRFPQSDLIPIAYYSIGDSYYNLSYYDSAIVFYNKILEEYPNTQYILDAVNGIQYAYLAKSQPNFAIDVIEKFVKENPSLKFSDHIYFKRGDIYYSLDDYTGAINAYKEFIQLYPKSELVPSAYFWIGKSAANLKKDNDAIENFNKVLEIAKKSEVGISATIELANLYSNKKQYSSAIQIINSCIDALPTSNRVPELLYLRGLAEVKDNNIKDAYNTFEQIIMYYEGNIFASKAKVELGKLEIDRGNYENAIKFLKETAENRLDDIGAQAQYYYGLALFNQNKINEAITAFVRVRSIFSAYDEWYTKSLLRLGDCYVKLNDKKLAREMYRAVLIRHPKGEYANEANKKLKQL
ncbi:MAG: tetratricopeptide repeat protein [Melioribacter sp.]|nr:tetratricopeptide repeat protein [Melioribacter sp.]